jgi:hypothetical protein
MAAADGVKTDQIARQMEAGDLLIALFSNGVAFNRSGADSIE